MLYLNSPYYITVCKLYQMKKQSKLFCTAIVVILLSNTGLVLAQTPSNDKRMGCPKKERSCKGYQVFDEGEYEGEFKYGLPHGWGTYSFNDGTVYIGEFMDGLRNGHGQQNFGNGDNFSGEWRNGLMHGKGVYLWEDASKYVGTFVEGTMQGKGILTLPNGESYDGEWRNGLANGEGEYNKLDGTKYNGNHADGKRQGTGVITFRTGDVFIGKWKHGMANKKGTFHFANGDKYMCIWENGEMTGEATYIMFNGEEISGGLKTLEQRMEGDENMTDQIGPNLGISWYAVALEYVEAKKYRLAAENFKIAQKFVTPSSDLNKLIYEQLELIQDKVEEGL